jgi:F-type H+-transporting ATPase subunit gamma
MIINSKTPYSSVKILSNELKTFFYQKPRLIQLIPIDSDQENLPENTLDNNNNTAFSSQDYFWSQKAEEILDKLAPQYIASNVNSFLIESLLAEQAARFLSMDTATRNAKKLLEETTLQYNKLRQAKITKELTELATNFE